MSSVSNILNCQVVLNDVCKHDHTEKYKMLNGRQDKIHSAPHQSIEVAYLDSIV